MLPTFMPVATQAAIKGLTPQQMEALGVTLILNNTYHLNLRPGIKILQEAGGAHKFQGWNNNLLTPEESISIQHAIGADIIMQLDDVVPSLETGPRVPEAMQRSVRWLDRCITQHEKAGRQTTQNLFAIVQGGLDPVLRDQCLNEMIDRKDRVAGYAIGGLSGGEGKEIFWRIIKQCADKLPLDRPRYAMGIGFAEGLKAIPSAITQHNLTFQAQIMGRTRDAILNGTFPAYLRTFFSKYFSTSRYPEWCVEALRSVGVDLLEDNPNAKMVSGTGAKWEYSDAS
ncbi:hypothetical protein EWM64_g1149 [Hericium alpestre]|uniref:tRNA-guanine(15) transglycosylase-like domain-containing protein n=1 Tax=Hericium alpestre TaxID=135208 RepID=A0A4Z0A985_9AGAM|nr:hypothetical protein EWM64_g1149 [Hericium alpestre]